MAEKFELKIVEDKVDPALDRREIIFEGVHEGAATPLRNRVREIIASKVNVDVNLVQIASLRSRTNSSCTTGLAYIYGDETRMKRLTPQHILIRSLGKEERAKLKAEKKKEAAKKPPPTAKQKP